MDFGSITNRVGEISFGRFIRRNVHQFIQIKILQPIDLYLSESSRAAKQL
jgi:hypothetical protein